MTAQREAKITNELANTMATAIKKASDDGLTLGFIKEAMEPFAAVLKEPHTSFDRVNQEKLATAIRKATRSSETGRFQLDNDTRPKDTPMEAARRLRNRMIDFFDAHDDIYTIEVCLSAGHSAASFFEVRFQETAHRQESPMVRLTIHLDPTTGDQE